MERLAFLIEETGQWVRCLLNPEGLTLQRQAGLQENAPQHRRLSGAGLSDDAMIFGGGGRTIIDLHLLFDVDLARGTSSDDVRRLSGPLLQLAENAGTDGPPIIRLIWGKSWNIPGVILAAAERYDHFTAAGTPRRSFMTMRFARVDAATAGKRRSGKKRSRGAAPSLAGAPSSPPKRGPLRMDQLAANTLGDPRRWRELAGGGQ